MKRWTAGFAVLVVLASVGQVNAEILLPDGYQSEVYLSGLGLLESVRVGPGGAWGTSPYVTDGVSQSVLRVTGKNAYETVASGFTGSGFPRLAFDKSGAFAGDMFVSSPFTSNFGDGFDRIYRITPSGNKTMFYMSSVLMTNGIAFGNGPGFGTNMYIGRSKSIDPSSPPSGLLRITPTGVGSNLEYGGTNMLLVRDDVAISVGGTFAEAAFLTDTYLDGGQVAHRLYRLPPNGPADLFVSGRPVQALAFSEGIFGDWLFGGCLNGDIYRYDAAGSESFFASGFGEVRSMDFQADRMWIATPNSLYLITIPEPSTLALFAMGALALLAYAWRTRRGR